MHFIDYCETFFSSLDFTQKIVGKKLSEKYFHSRKKLHFFLFITIIRNRSIDTHLRSIIDKICIERSYLRPKTTIFGPKATAVISEIYSKLFSLQCSTRSLMNTNETTVSAKRFFQRKRTMIKSIEK